MKRIVVRFGLASGAVLVAMTAIMLPLVLKGVINYVFGEVLGYCAMIISFLLVFFGIRSYRDSVGGGAVSFGKAFQVGILITLITCVIYVIAWEIAYFNLFPDFLDLYKAHVLGRLTEAGASAATIQKSTEMLAELEKVYSNPLYNAGITFLEVFPVGLVVTLVSALILRRKPRQPAPEPAMA